MKRFFNSLLVILLVGFSSKSMAQTINFISPEFGCQEQTLNLSISGSDLVLMQGTNVATDLWLQQNTEVIPTTLNSIQNTLLNATVQLTNSTSTGLYDVHVGIDGVSSVVLPNGFEVLPELPLLAAPDLVSPQNAAALSANPVVFSWTSVPNADAYQIQVAYSSGFSDLVQQSTVTSTNFTLQLMNNDYFWRVRTRNAAGMFGDWSVVRQLSMSSVTSLTSVTPNTGHQGQSLTLTITGTNVSFDAATATAEFRFEMGQNVMNMFAYGQNLLNGPNLDFTGTGVLQIPLNIPTGVYDLVYTDLTNATYSLPQAFTVTPAPPAPSIPALITPSNGAVVTVGITDFDWSDAANAQRYQIEISTSPTFATIVHSQSNILQSQYSRPLVDGSYFWRVRGRNAVNVWGDWSSVGTFEVVGASVISGLNPNTGYAGQNGMNLTITGENLPFYPTTNILEDITLIQGQESLPLSNVQLDNSTDGTGILNIPVSASLGYYDVVLEVTPFSPIIRPNSFLITEGNEFSGRVFIDVNQNQVIDAGDIPYSLVTSVAEPGGYVSTVQASGDFGNAVPPGSYTLSLNSLNYFTVSPSEYNFSFSGSGNQYSGYDFLLTPIQGQHDLRITAAATPLRQNMTRPVYITITNMGAEVESGTVSLTFAPGMTVDNASIAGYVVNGNTVSWNYSNLGLTEQLNIAVWLYTPISFNIGQEVDFVAQVTGQGVDQTPSDNVFNLDNQVVGPYDPNFKVVNPEGPIDEQFVSSGNYLSYTVHFQNVGNASAIDVYVLDTISELLDLSSMQFITASHGCVVNILNDRVVEFRFNDINLPDSASNEPGSKGYFSFRIKPVGSLQVNELIENTAYIYFDYNEAIVTNTTQSWIPLGISDGHNQSNWTVWPNPSSGQFQVSCKGIYEFIITDVSGRQVDAGIFKDASVLDLSELKQGVYFLRAKSEKNELVEKLIKY